MSDTIPGLLKNEVDLVKKTIVIKDEDSEFEFKIPTILDEVRVGVRMRKLRMMVDPTDDPGGNIDLDTLAYLKSMAYFELFLLSASNSEWVWARGPEGKQIVDSSQFPVEKTDQVLRVAAKVVGEVARFRNPSLSGERPAS